MCGILTLSIIVDDQFYVHRRYTPVVPWMAETVRTNRMASVLSVDTRTAEIRRHACIRFTSTLSVILDPPFFISPLTIFRYFSNTSNRNDFCGRTWWGRPRCPAVWLIDWLINRLIDWLFDWSIDPPTNVASDSSVTHFVVVSITRRMTSYRRRRTHVRAYRRSRIRSGCRRISSNRIPITSLLTSTGNGWTCKCAGLTSAATLWRQSNNYNNNVLYIALNPIWVTAQSTSQYNIKKFNQTLRYTSVFSADFWIADIDRHRQMNGYIHR